MPVDTYRNVYSRFEIGHAYFILPKLLLSFYQEQAPASSPCPTCHVRHHMTWKDHVTLRQQDRLFGAMVVLSSPLNRSLDSLRMCSTLLLLIELSGIMICSYNHCYRYSEILIMIEYIHQENSI